MPVELEQGSYFQSQT